MAASHPYEPLPQVNPFSAVVDGKFILYGGANKSALESFDPLTELWSPLTTTGSPPPPPKLFDGACSSINSLFFMFGGQVESSRQNSLYQLDLKNIIFKQLKPNGTTRPMKKDGCGMIKHDNSLHLFGGYGYPVNPWFNYYTNEMHTFSLEEGRWSLPVVSGTRPPPCRGFSLTMINDNTAVLFGGWKLGQLTNDVFILDLTNMHWSILSNEIYGPSPVGRYYHAAICLGYGEDHPKLLVMGGYGGGKVLNDMWLLDLQSRKWTKIDVPGLQPRCCHCAGALVLSSRLTEVIIFGGGDVWFLAATTVLRFDYANGEWKLIETLGFTDLATNPKRLREKKEQYDIFLQSQKRKTEIEAGLSDSLPIECYIQSKVQRKVESHEETDGIQDHYLNVEENEICLVAKLSSAQKEMQDELEWDNVGTWLPQNRLWKGEGELMKCLRVFFFDDDEHVLDTIYYDSKPLTPDVIMKIINEDWNMDGIKNGHYVPKFKIASERFSEVRVQFKSTDGSWSKLGSAAQSSSLDEPTVVLNFNHCSNDSDIQATIAHQFGHVLGLGHMHQDPKYWSVIMKFIDQQKMLKDLNISEKQFDTQWSNVEYIEKFFQHDEDSIMHYQTKLSWLEDQKYWYKDDLQHLKESLIITEDEYEVLRRFHKNTKFFCYKPSYTDKLRLAQAYHDLSEKITSR